jgi:hypothetical protein
LFANEFLIKLTCIKNLPILAEFGDNMAKCIYNTTMWLAPPKNGRAPRLSFIQAQINQVNYNHLQSNTHKNSSSR